jgi:hypothetical protein
MSHRIFVYHSWLRQIRLPGNFSSASAFGPLRYCFEVPHFNSSLSYESKMLLGTVKMSYVATGSTYHFLLLGMLAEVGSKLLPEVHIANFLLA